jgi:hypothetical protein
MRAFKPSDVKHAAPSRERAVFCRPADPGPLIKPASPWPETERLLSSRQQPQHGPPDCILGWRLLEGFREVGLRADGSLRNPANYPEEKVRDAIEKYLRGVRAQREPNQQKAVQGKRFPARRVRSPCSKHPKD